MFERIFPKQFDNAYRGHWLGLAFFVPVILLKAIQGTNSILMTRQIMTGADGIPLDTFGFAAAQNAVADFALLGMYLLLLPVIGAVALVRYRAMIPFLYLMLLLQQIGSRLILLAHPIPRTVAYNAVPIGLYINLAILVATVIGFGLSLLRKHAAGSQTLAGTAS